MRPATHVSQVQEDLSGEARDTCVTGAGGPQWSGPRHTCHKCRRTSVVRPVTHVSQVQEDLSGQARDTRVTGAGGPQW